MKEGGIIMPWFEILFVIGLAIFIYELTSRLTKISSSLSDTNDKLEKILTQVTELNEREELKSYRGGI
jgi:uncharacterized membrane protein